MLKNKSFFKKGFAEVDKANAEQARRSAEAQSKFGKIWAFTLKEEEGAIPIRFLTVEPLCYDEHVWQENGKWKTAVCEGDGCEHCSNGLKSRKVGAFLIADGREYESKVYDESGNDTGEKKLHDFSVKVLVRGMKDCTRINTLASRRGGLTENVYLVQRTGTGTATVYSYDKENDLDTDNPIFLGGELNEEALELIYQELPKKYAEMDFEDILMAQYVTDEEEEVQQPREVSPRTVRNVGRPAR